MIDIREFEHKADLLIATNKPMKFRLILQNGNMVERIISPVFVGNIIKCYRDQKNVYKPIKGIIENIQTVPIKSLRMLQSVENNSIKVEGNPVKNVIIELLKMKYEVINA